MKKKTNIGVLVEKEVWRQFRIYCLKVNQRPGRLLNEIIKVFLEEEKCSKG